MPQRWITVDGVTQLFNLGLNHARQFRASRLSVIAVRNLEVEQRMA